MSGGFQDFLLNAVSWLTIALVIGYAVFVLASLINPTAIIRLLFLRTILGKIDLTRKDATRVVDKWEKSEEGISGAREEIKTFLFNLVDSVGNFMLRGRLVLLAVAVLGNLLLISQCTLFWRQNALIEEQNRRIGFQNELLASQNRLFEASAGVEVFKNTLSLAREYAGEAERDKKKHSNFNRSFLMRQLTALGSNGWLITRRISGSHPGVFDQAGLAMARQNSLSDGTISFLQDFCASDEIMKLSNGLAVRELTKQIERLEQKGVSGQRMRVALGALKGAEVYSSGAEKSLSQAGEVLYGRETARLLCLALGERGRAEAAAKQWRNELKATGKTLFAEIARLSEEGRNEAAEATGAIMEAYILYAVGLFKTAGKVLDDDLGGKSALREDLNEMMKEGSGAEKLKAEYVEYLDNEFQRINVADGDDFTPPAARFKGLLARSRR